MCTSKIMSLKKQNSLIHGETKEFPDFGFSSGICELCFIQKAWFFLNLEEKCSLFLIFSMTLVRVRYQKIFSF